MSNTTPDSATAPPGAPRPAHPDLDTWTAYYAGELPEAAAERLREHLVSCRRCVTLLLDLNAFVHPGDSRRNGTSDFEKAAVWRTLEPRLAEAAAAKRHGASWQMPTALAASLLVGVLGLSTWRDQQRAIGDLRHEVAALSQPQLNAQIQDLFPASVQRSGRASAVEELSAARPITFVLTLDDPAKLPDYRIEIIDDGGAAVWSQRGLEMSPLETFELTLPPGFLDAGAYRLRLYGVDGDRDELLETYPLRVR